MELKTKIKNAIEITDRRVNKEHMKSILLLELSVLTATLSIIPIPLEITTILFILILFLSFRAAKNIKEYFLFRNKLVLMLKNLDKQDN